MIHFLALALLGLIGGLTALLVVKELAWLLRSLKYMKQGIPVRYFPFIGFVKHLDSPNKEDCMADFYELFKTPKNAKKSERLILMNGPTPEPIIFLNDEDLIKEFHLKETQVSYMHNLAGFPATNSLSFSKDPHRVQRDRAIFAEIFFPQNLKNHTPQIRKIVQRHFNRIKEDIKRTGAQTKDGRLEAEIELKPYVRKIFTDMVSFVLFGGEIPEVEGVLIVDQIKDVIEGSFKNKLDPLNLLSFELYSKLGLSPEFNKVKVMYRKIIKKLKEVVKERENKKNYQFGSNVIDLLILKNRELEAQGKRDQMMGYDEMAQNIFSLIFGGMDTSRNMTETALYKLSMEPELQSKLRKAARSQVLGTGTARTTTSTTTPHSSTPSSKRP